jgi:LmbE family N-acetylglucosaminyl deacetylase
MPLVSRLRSAEEMLSNQVLGSQSIGLDLWDAQVRIDYRRSVDNYPAREGFVFADDPDLRTLGEQDSIRHSILRIARTLAPTRVFFPLGLGSHLDHRYLRDQGMALHSEMQALGEPCSIYFYEDQPYATYDETDVQVATASLGECGLLTAEVIDVTASFEAKIQAVAAHRSQFRREENEGRLKHYASALAARAGLPDGHLAERIWRLDPR